MASTGLLVVSNIKQIANSLRAIEKYVSSLYIHLNIPPASSKEKNAVPAPTWGRMISQLYVDSSSSPNIDMRILVSPLKQLNFTGLKLLKPVDIIFSDSHYPEVCESLRTQLNISSKTIYLQQDASSDVIAGDHSAETLKTYESVVLGGTFDRIHLAHKIFLTQAVLRASRRLVVGVTTPNLLKTKTLAELIIPAEQRIAEVRAFLMDIDASLQYDIVPIDDPFGPTQSDPDMDLIVVSAETLRGGHKINEIRISKQLRPLEIYCIDLVDRSDDDVGPKEAKISSSNARIDILGTRLRKPESRPQLPVNPYIIGLTGGIASGKSKMAQRFQEMGAVVMDCDKIAHEIYAPGQKCYEKIVKKFGDEILVEKGGAIDRTKLGPIVFGNPQHLEALNAIVWPELMLEVKRRISALQADAANSALPQVVILEAAVLLKAGWQNECHEVWSMIVSPEHAVQRVMERNGLSEEEARKRLASQLDNSEVVAKSNVIFSSQWDGNFTRQQAEKAWQMLMRELKNKIGVPGSSML